MYNSSRSPRRRIKANGKRSPFFHINSCVAQGCPCSPALFILVAEALTRAALADSTIKGVKVNTKLGESVEVKISQFADDTLFMLRTYASQRGMWRLITLFEDATGMRLNKKKTEGIRCGRLASKPIPQIEGLDITSTQWVKFGTYVRLLGIPFWESGTTMRMSFSELSMTNARVRSPLGLITTCAPSLEGRCWPTQ